MPIDFRDPPAAAHRITSHPGRVKSFFAELADHPDRWAVFRERMTRGTASVYRAKYSKDYPNVEWRIVCETPEERGLRTVYVRWSTEQRA